MTGETDLGELLRTMAPVRQPGAFVFATADRLPDGVTVLASVLEPEGRSVVVSLEDATRLGLAHDFRAAWIRLDVHSSLQAVGLTAAVSRVLTERGISCNVVAGAFHDHLLVPEDRVDEAMDALRLLASGKED